MGLTLLALESVQRKHAQRIATYLESKGYVRDIPNNIFTKRYGSGFFDYYTIRYVGSYILISDESNKTCHKFLINEY
jgi:hypothetical protein